MVSEVFYLRGILETGAPQIDRTHAIIPLNTAQEWLGMDDPGWRNMMLTMIGLVVGMIMLISLLLALRYRPPAKDRAAILYRRFIEKTGLEPGVGETAERFARRAMQAKALPPTTIDAVTRAYHDARYGPAGEAAITRLKHAVSSIGQPRPGAVS